MVAKNAIFICGEEGERRCAALSGGRLVGLANERDIAAGAVYIGRIVGISNSMSCAFLDIGEDRNAFLHLADGNGKGLYKCGQVMIVQSQKNPRGGKGRQVTDRISLVGSLLCLAPGDNTTYVSSKITDPVEKDRLQSVASVISEQLGTAETRFGVSMRTMAQGCSEEAAIEEGKSLAEEWERCRAEFARSGAPRIIRGAGDFLEFCVSAFAAEDTSKVIVDSAADADRLFELKKTKHSCLSFNVHLYSEQYDMFDFYNISSLIKNAFERRITLPSGGTIVIDSTEALTAIDVNSGRGSRGTNVALKTNLEAADEIAAQLKLRNVGGIVVIDFINMEDNDRKIVREKVNDLFSKDKKISKVCDFSPLGLVELSRRR